MRTKSARVPAVEGPRGLPYHCGATARNEKNGWKAKWNLLRYNEGGFYTIHTDNYKDRPRTVAMSLMLNDDYDGGEIAFFEREHIIKPSAGSAVIFPANFMYPHEIMPVLAGTRYAIITWFT